MRHIILLLLAVTVLSASSSRAAIVINMVESAGDVVATLSGSIDSLVGASLNQSGASTANQNFVRASDAYFIFSDIAPPSFGLYDNYDIPTAPANFGSGGLTFSTSSTASTSMLFRASAPQLWISQDYTLSTPVTGTLTWAGSDFTTLGVTEGTYVWDWGGDSMTLNIGGAGPAAVPEPGQVAASVLLLAGIGGYVLLNRRHAAKRAGAA